jgi:hypothetical protein
MSKQSEAGSQPTVDKVKVRKLMRFWSIGTFIITFTAVTTYAIRWTGFLIFREPLYWVIIVVSGLASAVVLLIDEWWLRRK